MKKKIPHTGGTKLADSVKTTDMVKININTKFGKM